MTVSATGVAGTGTLGNEVAAGASVSVTGVSSTMSFGTVNQVSVYKLTNRTSYGGSRASYSLDSCNYWSRSRTSV